MRSFIEKRIDSSTRIDQELYVDSLLEVIGYLINELYDYLQDEGRYVGIVIDFIKTIDNATTIIEKQQGEIHKETYQKVLFLLKPVLQSEFKRLHRYKRLSRGDSVIVITKRIIDMILSLDIPCKYPKELKNISRILDKFHNNIRNKGKNDPLYLLLSTIKDCMYVGAVGKFITTDLNLEPCYDKAKEWDGEESKLVVQGEMISNTKEVDL